MKILAWDTSTSQGSVALYDGERQRLLSEWHLNLKMQHSERLLWSIHHVLEATHLKLADISAFAVGQGPGSFTGLRIGITTARTLAHHLHRPLIGLSSLVAQARSAADWVIALKGEAMLNVARGVSKTEAFFLRGKASEIAQSWTRDQDEQRELSLWHPQVHETWGTWDEFLNTWAPEHEKLSDIFLGDFEREQLERLKANNRGSDEADMLLHPRCEGIGSGGMMAKMGYEVYQKGYRPEALGIKPRYLRRSHAEQKRAAGLLGHQAERGESSSNA